MKQILLIFVLMSVVSLFAPVPVAAQGLVPACEGASCSACHLVTLANNVIDWLIGFLTIVFAALVMVAGFRLVTSGGNTSAREAAKSSLTNAVIGFIIVLAAWILIDTLMRALIGNDGQINGSMPWAEIQCWEQTSVGTEPYNVDTYQPPVGYGGAGTAGSCSVPSSGYCSPSQLNSITNNCFGSNVNNMAQICNLESHGNPRQGSGTDQCRGGVSWSYGLYQINIMAHGEALGCGELFTINTANAETALDRELGTCLRYVTNSNGFQYCQVRNCQVKNQSAYNACVNKVTDPEYNLNYACSLYKNGTYQPWSGSASRCGII